MKKFLAILGCACSTLLYAQQPYWQQQVNFTINVSLNDQDHSLRGTEEIEYINNSPDRLDFIWFHLWPNAYKNEGTAYARQIFRDKDGKDRWKKMKDKGFIDSLAFTVDGQKATWQADPDNIDVIKLILPRPLEAGGKVKISTPFYVKIPTYSSRSGHNGQSYMMAQWYPKPAVYDRKGWHPIPYLDQGEFYNDYGNYEVNLTLPSNYIVGATGVMQNTDERGQYVAMGKENVTGKASKNKTTYKVPSSPRKTLNFKAENVTDFAWFADKNFVVRYDTLQVEGGKVVDVFTYHHPDGNRNWVNSTGYVKSGTRAFSSYLGTYPYPVVQAVEGPKNEMSGGMEYPMITLITSPDATEEMLDAVITHEVGHNWLAIILGTNERTHAWMDEGINTYYQFRYEADKYRTNSIFGKSLPAEMKSQPLDEFLGRIYGAINTIPMKEAIDIPSADYKDKEEYGLITYIKTALWMYILEQQAGREKLDAAMKTYFDQWKFRHPYPEDLKTVLEKELSTSLTPFFDLLKKKENF